MLFCFLLVIAPNFMKVADDASTSMFLICLLFFMTVVWNIYHRKVVRVFYFTSDELMLSDFPNLKEILVINYYF